MEEILCLRFKEEENWEEDIEVTLQEISWETRNSFRSAQYNIIHPTSLWKKHDLQPRSSRKMGTYSCKM